MLDDRLKRLKDTILHKPEDEGLEEIISKLKPREDEARAENKLALDWKKVSISGEGIFNAIGKFYAAFEKPLRSTAGFISNMPGVRQLENNLRAAAMPFNTESYLVITSTVSLFIALITFVFLVTLTYGDFFSPILSALVAVIVFLFSAAVLLFYPITKANERASAIDKALPFALRQLATQLRAGVSFYKSLNSLAKSEYGVLSLEFDIVLRDLDSGLSTEEALKRLSQRVKSDGLRKAVMQIVRAMKTGGNLSLVISEIADDVSFETRQQIRDFTEKLNLVSILYIMFGIVMPVVVAILAAVLQIPLFAGVLPDWFVYAGFGMSIVLMIGIVYVTRKLEPAAW